MGAQADQIRDDIIGRILARRLLPGDRIDEAELRQRLGVSGTPVREAVLILEATGVVERQPRGGARVASVDLEGLMKHIEALAEAEGAVAFRAARRVNPEQARMLEETVQACEAFVKSGNAKDRDYYDLNLDFHLALIKSAGNEHLGEAVLRTGNRLIGYLSARHTLPGEAERSAAEHRLIHQAVIGGEAERARQLMIDHVMMSNAVALDVMNLMRAAR